LKPNFHAFVQSFCMVSIAEVFDKTWFVTLVMALMHDKLPVFWGSSLALILHTFIAAVAGYGISKLFSISTLHVSAAILYAAFAVLYAWEWFSDKDADLLAEGRREAEDVLKENHRDAEYGSVASAITGFKRTSTLSADTPADHPRNPSDHKALRDWVPVLGRTFSAVFIAEWGDRTQIAMIGQHASHPLIPVMVGSALAFCILSGSAVLLGMVLGSRTFNKRTVYALSATCFAIFAILSLRDGLLARTT